MIRAILGGSFDPVHNGHLAIVNRVLADHLADEIIVIPTWRSPHKSYSFAPPEDRLAMARLAFSDNKKVLVDDREVVQGASVYTVTTLKDLSASFPNDILRLIVGADNLLDFGSWHQPAEILQTAELIVLARSGAILPDRIEDSFWPAERFLLVEDFHEPVSSTEIRAKLAAGELPVGQLPKPVARYITSHKLYSQTDS